MTDPSIFKELDRNPAGMDPTVKAGYIKNLKVDSEYMKSKGVTSDTIEISGVKCSDNKHTVDFIIHYPNTRKSAKKMALVKFDDKWYVQSKW